MPFVKYNAKEELEKELKKDPSLKKYCDEFDKQYELRKQLIEVRKQLIEVRKQKGLTQKEVAKKSGLTQQMVSRIETIGGNTPTLDTFMKYVNALDMDIKIEARN